MSFWTMGFNQHTRGVWCNNLVYNLHLLTGKISTPGNSPFSLTGQPSACGTAREVGTFSHRLPADMVVTNPKHRATAETDLEASGRHNSRQARLSRGSAEPDAEGRQAQRVLGDGQQQHAGRREPDAGRPARLSQPGELHRRVGRVSDGDDACRRPRATGGDVGREGRRIRQRRAAHAVLASTGRRAGEARSDLWQLVEFSKRFKMEEVWPKELLDAKPEYRGKTLYDVLYRNGSVDKFPVSQMDPEYANAEAKAFGFYLQKGLFEEYAEFGRGHGHDLAPFDAYHEARGLRWPVVNGKETLLALSRRLGSVRQEGHRLPVLRQSRRQGGDLGAAVRAAARGAGQGVSVLAVDRAACSSTGTRDR